VAALLFVRWERRTDEPLVDLALVRPGLLGALCGYLVLFGPLVAVPFALDGPPVTVGLVLTALPGGFALAATIGASLLPRTWSNTHRCVFGAGLSTAALLALVVLPTHPLPLVIGLACLGVGLGVFTPANNAAVMAEIPAHNAGLGGGLVNTTRGLGTALGVAVSTAALHAGAEHGLRIVFGTLAICALISGFSSRFCYEGSPSNVGC
jgi:predicted MFS family arabinose efflux permease